MTVHVEEVMGTVFTLRHFDDDPVRTDRFLTAVPRVCEELHRIDATYSTWKPTSTVSRFRRGDTVERDDEFEHVLTLCGRAISESGGYFDPWSAPGGFDPTGLVKGYAVDLACEIFVEEGCGPVIVNGGGDLRLSLGDPVAVGITHPSEQEALMGVVEVRGSLASSGTYERGDHLYHPFGGRPVGVASSVLGAEAWRCDALATAVCVGGGAVLALVERLEGYEALLVTPDLHMSMTSGFEFLPVDVDVDAEVAPSW
ncbi:MAG: FAD:protein FMN transferase [Acidimicrobiales bacterium]